MEPLDLDSGDYDGTYKLIGGRLALDFVNTVSWPDSDRQHDWLSSPENLDRWCAASFLAPAPRAEASDVAVARGLRSELADIVTPLAFDGRPTPQAITSLNARLAQTLALRNVDPDTLSWTWRTPTNVVERLAPVVLDSAEILAMTNHERLGHCKACNWLFDDQSRNGRRRWCDMADCGSRAKSRTYYQRTKARTTTNQEHPSPRPSRPHGA